MQRRRTHDLARSYLPALLIGAVAALHGFPLAALAGRLPAGIPPGTDLQQHMAGQLCFVAQPWHWPLFRLDRLDAPHGVNLALTDAIPLMAVVVKLLHPLVPPLAQGIGPWFGLAWLLQPVAAVYALRGTGERRPSALLAVAVIAASMPTFLYRVAHAALDGHALLLLALGLYLRATGPGAGRGPTAALAALLAITLFVHPYLMVMVAAFAVAVPVTLAARRARAAGRAAALALAGVAAAMLLAWVSGELQPGDPGDVAIYSMNLAAPLWPAMSRVLPWFPAQLMDATGGQFEGYQYLGAGLLVLLGAVGLDAAGRAWFRAGARRHVGLLLGVAVLAAYAVSTHVWLLQLSLLRWDVALPGARALRASGRLFWPAAYVLLVAGVRGASLTRGRAAPALLLAAAALQVFDTWPMRAEVHARELRAWTALDPSTRELDAALARAGALVLQPRIECDAAEVALSMPVVFAAARHDLPTNTMYAARIEPANACDPAAPTAALPPGALGVAYGAGRAAQEARWRRAGFACRALGGLSLCRRPEDAAP